jgi:hypothetical protein
MSQDKNTDKQTLDKWLAFFAQVKKDGFASCGVDKVLYTRDEKFVKQASKQVGFKPAVSPPGNFRFEVV